MHTLEITSNADVVCITIDRAALNAAMLTRITNELQAFVAPSEPLTASDIRRLPLHERDRILAEQTARAEFELISGGEEPA